MPSDRRLHPLSPLFSLGAQLRTFGLPGLVVLVTGGAVGLSWQVWMMPLLLPALIALLGDYLTFRYRYEAHEMVIRKGLLSRSERHIPYARIQNLDAVQNVLHRLLGVVEVRIETGGGGEPEARLRVLPVADYEEMRRRVFAERMPAEVPEQTDAAAPVPAAGRTLLHLPGREILLLGLLQNRGAVILAAGFGLLLELGMMDRAMEAVAGDRAAGGVVRAVLSALDEGGALPVGWVALAVTALAGLLLFLRLLSMVWAAVQLHGFRLTLVGEDLRTEYGLLTRVLATIPLRRIQTLTIRESPLYRRLGRVSVRVDTAGGESGKEGEKRQREWLAPILRRRDLPGLLREVLPGLDLAAVDWRAAPPRAFRRVLRQWVLVALVISPPLALPILLLPRWWFLVLLAVLLAWAFLMARLDFVHLGWAVAGGVVLFRRGALWRQTSVAPFGKIQAVTLHESPFDRRHGMARVKVDTAGAGNASHRVDIPYLPRDTAESLYDLLAAEAAGTAFRW